MVTPFFFVKPHKMSAVVAALLPGFRACFQMRNKFNIAQSTEVAKYGVLYEIGFYRVSCFVLAVPLHNSLFLSICFPLLFSSTPPPPLFLNKASVCDHAASNNSVY